MTDGHPDRARYEPAKTGGGGKNSAVPSTLPMPDSSPAVRGSRKGATHFPSRSGILNLGKFHTRKGKTLFVYFKWDVHWPSWGKEFWLYDIPEPVESAFIPATGQEIEAVWGNGKLRLKNLPKQMPDIMGTVALRLK